MEGHFGMKPVLVAFAGLLLAACGVDGEPFYPTVDNEVSLSEAGVSTDIDIAVNVRPLTRSSGGGL